MKKIILAIAIGMIAVSCEKETIEPTNETIESVESVKGKQTKDGVLIADVLPYTYGTWRTIYRENKFENSSQWVPDNANNENLIWQIDSAKFKGYNYQWDQSFNRFEVYFLGNYDVISIDIINGRMQLFNILPNNSVSKFTIEKI